MAVTLMSHQLAAVERARRQPRYGLGHDCGTGKTISALSICAERPMRTVVVAPKALLWCAWAEDARLVDVPAFILHGTKTKRQKLLEAYRHVAPGPLLVTTPEMFKTHANDFRDLRVSRLVFDESSKLKDPKTGITKAAHQFADTVDEVYLLTGTPAPNGPHEYWGQLRALDPRPGGWAGAPGSRRLPGFYEWANYWLIPIQRHLGAKTVTVGWRIRENRKAAFEALIAEAFYMLKAEDCIDLPDETIQVVPVDLSPKERRVYDGVIDDLVAGLGADSFEVSAQAAAMKLRQVCGGTIKTPEGEYHDIGDSKVKALVDLAGGVEGQPFLVWTQFQSEPPKIEAALSRIGRKVGICDGQHSAKIDDSVAAFKAGKLDTLICHPQSVGHGVTLTESGGKPCRSDFIYTPQYSYELDYQLRKRIHRMSQRMPVVHTYLCARDTVDERAIEAVGKKQDASNAVIDAVRAEADRRKGEAA